MNTNSDLIPKHGGYRNLKSFQVAQLVYDVTVRFCERYVEAGSRTRDQMVQAARSGVQNIAEGSQASGTSKKMELKLTNVARASLEELRLDYEDFLRQRGLEVWGPDHPALRRFKAKRCSTLEEVRRWVEEEGAIGRREGKDEHGQGRPRTDTHGHGQDRPRTNTDEHGLTRTDGDGAGRGGARGGRDGQGETDGEAAPGYAGTRGAATPAQLVANAALSLLNVACYLLDRQLASQAEAFEREGGFTERLYRTRTARRTTRE